jgi:protein SCO1/2
MSQRAASWRTAVASLCVAAAGFAVAHDVTDGFRAYTLESARRIAALEAPTPVPSLALEWSDGHRTPLIALEAPVLLVDFIYTRCESYCAALGGVFAQLQQRLTAEIARGEVRLVSISFDARDDAAALTAYRDRHQGDPAAWLLARPQAASHLATWLDAFGVVVIPDELGGFAHNAAVHVVGPDRRLRAIHELGAIDEIVASARAATERHRLASAR